MASTAVNAHWAFHEAPKDNDFLNALTIPDGECKAIISARDEIRAALRDGLGDWKAVIAKVDLFESAYLRANQAAQPVLRPRFRMQGSWAYHTANDPAQKLHQRVDLDDGVYMPVDFILASSRNQPVLASKGFFRAVETILEPICNKQGWALDKAKNSCVRVIISQNAHIDLPLYAIPAKQFAIMTDSLTKILGANSARLLSEGVELASDYYRLLDTDQIMLAHRSGSWEPSDPRKIEDWFQRAIDSHGYVLRRICRYLKAWRDCKWRSCKLSSLAIMVCVVDIVGNLAGDLTEKRDDAALQAVTEQLPDRLRRRIDNPALPGAESALDREWSSEDRAMFILMADELHDQLGQALNGTDSAAIVLDGLRAGFGKRITNDTSVIRFVRYEDTIKSYPKATVPAPIVGRTTSG